MSILRIEVIKMIKIIKVVYLSGRPSGFTLRGNEFQVEYIRNTPGQPRAEGDISWRDVGVEAAGPRLVTVYSRANF